jgi:hypothetical protein
MPAGTSANTRRPRLPPDSAATTPKTLLREFYEGDIFYRRDDANAYVQVKSVGGGMITITTGTQGRISDSVQSLTVERLIRLLKSGK